MIFVLLAVWFTLMAHRSASISVLIHLRFPPIRSNTSKLRPRTSFKDLYDKSQVELLTKKDACTLTIAVHGLCLNLQRTQKDLRRMAGAHYQFTANAQT